MNQGRGLVPGGPVSYQVSGINYGPDTDTDT